MSITTRIVIVVMIAGAMVLLGVGLAGQDWLERTDRQQAQIRAQLLASVLKVAAEADLREHGRLGTFADAVAKAGLERVVFFGSDGRPVAPVPRNEYVAPYANIRRVIERGEVEDGVFQYGQDHFYVYRLPLLDARHAVAGALELRINLDEAGGQRRWIKQGVFVGASLLIVLALFVGLYARWTIRRPLKGLLDGMDHVIRGDLAPVLPLDSSAEVGQIAYRFNEMTARLRAAQDEIHQSAEAKLKLEARLRRSEKLATVGQVSAEIAHEVGTPLNVIGGRARSLLKKVEQPEEVTKNARIIGEQVDRITKIIRQALDIARAPMRGTDRVDMPQLVESVLSFLEYQIQQANVAVECDWGNQAAPVVGDADGFQQVVLNLLLNAIQAMPQGGILKVGVQSSYRRRQGLDVAPPQLFTVLVIEDSGYGIPKDALSGIFDPFFSTKERGEGSGLGLTVVRGIVKAHDGWIDVENRGSDDDSLGTIFRVYLPAQASQASPAI